jgi:hypothetical protein
MVRFIADTHKPIVPENSFNERVLQLASFILGHFFGDLWIKRHLFNNRFLRTDMAKWKGNKIDEISRSFDRQMNLAEMLLNLQYVNGFDGPLTVLGRGDIEAGYAELEVATILSRYQVGYSFNSAPQVTKGDYDLNVIFKNGRHGCADTKCIIESAALSELSILYRLQRARRQLPDDKPGAIFIKIPEEWATAETFREKLEWGVSHFFKGHKSYRGTTTVVAVNAYSSFLQFTNNAIERFQNGLEFYNDSNKFGSTDWAIISEAGIVAEETRYPPWWKLLVAFMDSGKDPRLLRIDHGNSH